MPQSLYIHIPFCSKKCLYCDFYSCVYEANTANAYIDVLCRQIEKLEDNFYTIYIGGGTPTVLEPRLLQKLLNSLSRLAKNAAEFSMEANPESLHREKIKILFDAGVNRLSIGVQSLDDNKLQRLGRIHSAKSAIEAVSFAQKFGVKNIGIDLIFGVWQETLKDWEKELKQACSLGISHISSYNLTYEKHTPLFKKLRNKEIYPLSEESVCAMYKYAMNYLPRQGFLQYEISNFAKIGFECKHNLNYWQNNSYIGLGPSAVSYCDDVRQRNIAGTKDYIAKIMQKENPVSFKEKLIPQKRAKETAALKIRTKEGINFHWFRKKTDFDFMELEKNAAKFLYKQRLVKYLKNNNQAGGICLTEKGFLFCDTVCSELL